MDIMLILKCGMFSDIAAICIPCSYKLAKTGLMWWINWQAAYENVT